MTYESTLRDRPGAIKRAPTMGQYINGRGGMDWLVTCGCGYSGLHPEEAVAQAIVDLHRDYHGL